MANGAILPIFPPATNSSYEIDFFGPSIKCESVNETTRLAIRRGILAHLQLPGNVYDHGLELYAYMGWFPGRESNRLGTLSPFESNGSNYAPFYSGELTHTFYLFAASREMTETYMALGERSRAWENGVSNATADTIPAFLDGTMLECRWFNSSYHVRFNFTDGLQDIDIQTSSEGVEAPIYDVTGAFGPRKIDGRFDCMRFTARGNLTACIFDEPVLKGLTYQAVWDAFTTILGGSVYYPTYSVRTRNSSVLDTVLVNTPELFALREYLGESTEEDYVLQTTLGSFDDRVLEGLVTTYDSSWNLSLGDALEEMFRNATVSLMSSSALQ